MLPGTETLLDGGGGGSNVEMVKVVLYETIVDEAPVDAVEAGVVKVGVTEVGVAEDVVDSELGVGLALGIDVDEISSVTVWVSMTVTGDTVVVCGSMETTDMSVSVTVSAVGVAVTVISSVAVLVTRTVVACGDDDDDVPPSIGTTEYVSRGRRA